MNRLAVDFLEAVAKHGPIDLGEKIGADLSDVIRADSEQIGVESRMVDLAQRQAICDVHQAAGSIRDDVGSVEQLASPQATDRALLPVCGEDANPELGLHRPLTH